MAYGTTGCGSSSSSYSHGAYDEGETYAWLEPLGIPAEVEAVVSEDAELYSPPAEPIEHIPHFVLLLMQNFLLWCVE